MTDKVAVLVVEDDQVIQGLVEEALLEGGFQPTSTSSGEEAAKLLRNPNCHFRAVISDINLSGTLTGWDVARYAREACPSVPIIYMTGTHGEEWASKGVPNSVLLSKPFAPAQLVTALSTLLNDASSPTPPIE